VSKASRAHGAREDGRADSGGTEGNRTGDAYRDVLLRGAKDTSGPQTRGIPARSAVRG
jgi:hypothetical protein